MRWHGILFQDAHAHFGMLQRPFFVTPTLPSRPPILHQHSTSPSSQATSKISRPRPTTCFVLNTGWQRRHEPEQPTSITLLNLSAIDAFTANSAMLRQDMATKCVLTWLDLVEFAQATPIFVLMSWRVFLAVGTVTPVSSYQFGWNFPLVAATQVTGWWSCVKFLAR